MQKAVHTSRHAMIAIEQQAPNGSSDITSMTEEEM